MIEQIIFNSFKLGLRRQKPRIGMYNTMLVFRRDYNMLNLFPLLL